MYFLIIIDTKYILKHIHDNKSVSKLIIDRILFNTLPIIKMGCGCSSSKMNYAENSVNDKRRRPTEEMSRNTISSNEDERNRSSSLSRANSKLGFENPNVISTKNALITLECFLNNSPSFFNPEHKPVIFEYQFEEHLGRGTVSDVFRVYNVETNVRYAAKVYDKAFLYRQNICEAELPIYKVVKEISIMSECSHPNILSLHEVIDDEETNSLILILPFADEGALSKSSWKANRLPEDQAKKYFRQIAHALQYLHSKQIIHRDIKPENVLMFSDGSVSLADFSVSTRLENPDAFLEDTAGTPVFYSPEQCSGKPYKGKPADCWAFGILLYVMIYGKLPFFDPEDERKYGAYFFKISQVIQKKEISYPDYVKITPDLADLFSHVLDSNPETRYNID